MIRYLYSRYSRSFIRVALSLARDRNRLANIMIDDKQGLRENSLLSNSGDQVLFKQHNRVIRIWVWWIQVSLFVRRQKDLSILNKSARQCKFRFLNYVRTLEFALNFVEMFVCGNCYILGLKLGFDYISVVLLVEIAICSQHIIISVYAL